MTNRSWVWHILLGIFFLGLILLAYFFYLESANISQLNADAEVDSEFEGNDWITWQYTEWESTGKKGVIATDVHPLRTYKPTEPNDIQPGDRLRKIRYNEIRNAETVDNIISAKPPGEVLIFITERTNPNSLSTATLTPFVRNGFRLGFAFNKYGIYWQIMLWGVGIGAIAALIMLAILLPIMRSNWRENLSLLGLVVSGLIFFLTQVIHNVYLIVESDLTQTGVEKIYIFVYPTMLFVYAIYYFYHKSGSGKLYFALPSLATAFYLLSRYYDIIFLQQKLKVYHDLIEKYTFLFFFIHILAAIGLYIAANWNKQSKRSFIGIGVISLLSIFGIWYYSMGVESAPFDSEHALFLLNLMLFFPLVNATFLQLQFGKVSVVLTRTIQYLIILVVSILIYLVIGQLFSYILTNNPYQRILEFITFLFAMAILWLLYLANENKFRKYFVTSQQEKRTRFKSFIAQIPQYTSSRILRKDLVEQLSEYFGTETVHLWWKGDAQEGDVSEDSEAQERIYRQLTGQNTIWSKSKEIASFKLKDELEKVVQKSAYTLMSPITVNDEGYALLMLGRKKRGVYNLLDLELISQLVQQTQLTLNVLQLVNREKELIQQTYEANLTALRSQINPHFLFNTLNTITELVHGDPEEAEEAIEKLAFIFRYTLKVSNQNFVSLSSELQLVSTYLDIEKFRFGDRLDIHLDIAKEVREVQIPAFILQTLTENCIKHGVSKILGQGRVSIEAFREDDYMVCEVNDNGPGIDLTRIQKSTGLSNTLARLENIYEMKNLLYFENTGSGTYVRLKIPIVEIPEMN